jgi:hypothetical protein
VVVRVPGAIRHRLVVRSLRVRHLARGRRVIELVIANTGNAVERLRSHSVALSLVAHRRVIARLRPPNRELLPGSRAIVDVAYAGSVRGQATARVVIGSSDDRHTTLRRSFRVRL